MALSDTQMPEVYKEIIDEQVEIWNKGTSVTVKNAIPETTDIPIENPKYWLRIPDVICVYVDMKDSTRLSAVSHDQSTAGAYQLFTGTVVRLFARFEAPYIDVRGDGAFALFNQDQPYRALAAAVTIKTFGEEVFRPKIEAKTDVKVGCHIGIDQKTVLVRKIGLKRHSGRSDRQNEVWAGKPVNMAAKLAAMGEHNQLHIADRYFEKLTDEHTLKSCGCPKGVKKELWKEVPLSEDDRFDFDTAYLLESCWCSTHGKEYCGIILGLDED